ncbi:MAG: ATP-binding protein [Bacilli bacterium]
MFGKILNIDNNNILVENTSGVIETSILNMHVVFESSTRKIVGEIRSINNSEINIFIIGEFINDSFILGTSKLPSINDTIRLIYKSEVISLYGKENNLNYLYLGKSSLYQGFNIYTKVNEFFGGHFAIIGNTGCGKTCASTRMIQNLLFNNDNPPLNANIVLFDIYGEYNSAFTKMNEEYKTKTKIISTSLEFNPGDTVNIPAYFLDADDLALILKADSKEQIPILEKALSLVYTFCSNDEKVLNHKNNILAVALLDILSSGRSSTQIRDQIIAVLTTYNTKDINLNSQIIQPGYTRTLKQCLNIDAMGKINTIQLAVSYLESFKIEEMTKIERNEFFTYSLKDLLYSLEFALISEGILKSDKVYEKNNILKVRLSSLIKSPNARFFDVKENISKQDFVYKLFSLNGEKVQLVNINLDSVDERFGKTLTKIYSKLFYDVCVHNKDRASFIINIVLEEAHRYVTHDIDSEVIGYNIFDRITKEGRKYGVLLGLITQRPSELSSTALSQCSNFIVLRMYNPNDLNIIKSISSNVSQERINAIKNYEAGEALCFGTSFSLPSSVKFDMPSPVPSCSNANIVGNWYKKNL